MNRAACKGGRGGPTGGKATNHGAEALGDRGDGAGVGAIWRHAGIAVQQRIASHAHIVEPDLAIVHTIQARLGGPQQLNKALPPSMKP